MIAASIAAVGIASAGCSDSPTQSRGLEVRVSPDVVRIDPGSRIVAIRYALRNTAETDLVTTSASPDVQVEQSPGSWTTLVDSLASYIQSSLGGTPVSRGESVEQVTAHYFGPGRFRLRLSYRPIDSRGITVPAAPREALSNVFTVTP